jgi:hypothetical protein
MSNSATSLRLHGFASLAIFISSYAPLLIILIVKDIDLQSAGLPFFHPVRCLVLFIVAVYSCFVALNAAKNITGGLKVEVTKASNKSGEMFAYTIPYMLSFVRIDISDWQTMASLAIFLAMMFIIAYRTQTVFVNPVLALAGYMMIDCTFTENAQETQAMVLTRAPLKIAGTYKFERLSYYLYAATEEVAAERQPREG